MTGRVKRRGRSAGVRRVWPGSVTAACALALAGCISGRVLTGYPGYPFATFVVADSAGSTFFALQRALVEEGYAIDYSLREQGLINTQPGPEKDNPLVLNVVVADEEGNPASARVWIAGYRNTSGGARRVTPLDETLWERLMAVAGRVSRRLDGSEPRGPEDSG